MGEIGFPRREFLYDIAFWEVRRIIKGYRKRSQTFCEMLRWQTWWYLQPHVKKDSIRKPAELATFPWEKEEVEEYSEEDVNEIRELIRKTNESSKP